MATMIPASGSAYTYSYVVIGELLAWIVGWSLILEYSLVVSAVAVGWSGYAAPLLQAWAGFPMALMQGPELGGIVNLPAIAIDRKSVVSGKSVSARVAIGGGRTITKKKQKNTDIL